MMTGRVVVNDAPDRLKELRPDLMAAPLRAMGGADRWSGDEGLRPRQAGWRTRPFGGAAGARRGLVPLESDSGTSVHRSPCVRRTLAFTCRARLNDRPASKKAGRTFAPCLVQRVVVRHFLIWCHRYAPPSSTRDWLAHHNPIMAPQMAPAAPPTTKKNASACASRPLKVLL
jgi:hypothetical protein